MGAHSAAELLAERLKIAERERDTLRRENARLRDLIRELHDPSEPCPMDAECEMCRKVKAALSDTSGAQPGTSTDAEMLDFYLSCSRESRDRIEAATDKRVAIRAAMRDSGEHQ